MYRFPTTFIPRFLRIATFHPRVFTIHHYCYSTFSQPVTRFNTKVCSQIPHQTYRFKRQWITEKPSFHISDPLSIKPTLNDNEQVENVIMDIDENLDTKECATPRNKHTHRRKRVKNAEKGRLPFVNAIICRICFRKKRPGAKCKNCIGVRSKTTSSS